MKTKPRGERPPTLLTLRVDGQLVKRLDRVVEARMAKEPGVMLSRADIVRTLLLEALPAHEEG